MPEIAPLQLYQPGDVLAVMSDGEQIATALVIGFDPSFTSYVSQSTNKERRPMKDHWHVAVRWKDGDKWLPAAVYDDPEVQVALTVHVSKNHIEAERRGDPAQYSVQDLMDRVSAIALRATGVEKTERKYYCTIT